MDSLLYLAFLSSQIGFLETSTHLNSGEIRSGLSIDILSIVYLVGLFCVWSCGSVFVLPRNISSKNAQNE